MRWTCLPLLATLAACATQGEGPYDVYDPSAPVDIQSMSTMEPVMATANAAPWVNEHGKTFLGFTAPQTGRWTWPGAEVGLEAGDAACKAQGADHACTLAEIVIAEEAGELARAPADITFWINDEDAPAGGRCGNVDRHARGGSYTYEGADRSWSGQARTSVDQGRTSVLISVPPDVRYDARCLSDPDVCASFIPSGYPCNAQRAIACCG